MDASVFRDYPVAVSEPVLSTAERDALVDGFLSNIVSAGSEEASINTDDLRQNLAYSSSLMNQVDCSNSPNCSALHRKVCSSLANTCGTCISPFVGDYGPGNNLCVNPTYLASPTNVNSSCSSTADCSGTLIHAYNHTIIHS